MNSNDMDVKFPKIWPGYFLGGITLASFFVVIATKATQRNEGPAAYGAAAASALMIFGFIAGLVYWTVSVYRLHKTLLAVTDQKYPISAGQAAGYQFIPLFNIYWMFKWPLEIARFVDHCNGDRAMGKYRYGVMLLLASMSARVLTGISIVIEFAVLSALIKRLKGAVAERAMPVGDYEKPKYNGRTAMVCLWAFVAFIVIAMIAAIAIPNFTKARDDARAKNAAPAAAPVI